MSRQLLMAGAAALALLASPARAADIPAPCDQSAGLTRTPALPSAAGIYHADPRERCIDYRPNSGQVIRAYAAVGAVLLIELPPGQTVFYNGISDNSLITGETQPATRMGGQNQAVTEDSNLMVWVPGAPESPQNYLQVKPIRHLEAQPFPILAWWTNPETGKRELRRYNIELRTRPGELTEDMPETFFSIRIRDPAAEAAEARARARGSALRKAEEAERWAALREQRDERQARSRLRQNAVASYAAGKSNTRYRGQGTDDDRMALAPAAPPGEPAMWDDGQRTYLRFPGNRPTPLAYQVQGVTETFVGQHTEEDPTTRGSLLVLHGVFPQIRLRTVPDAKSERVLCIFNLAFNPVGQNPGTGTVDPGVQLQAREPRRVAVR